MKIRFRAYLGNMAINAMLHAVRPDVNGVFVPHEFTCEFKGRVCAAEFPALCEKLRAAFVANGDACLGVEVISVSEDSTTPTKPTADDVAPKDT